MRKHGMTQKELHRSVQVHSRGPSQRPLYSRTLLEQFKPGVSNGVQTLRVQSTQIWSILRTPECTSIRGLMVSIRWYLAFLKGQLGGAAIWYFY